MKMKITTSLIFASAMVIAPAAVAGDFQHTVKLNGNERITTIARFVEHTAQKRRGEMPQLRCSKGHCFLHYAPMKAYVYHEMYKPMNHPIRTAKADGFFK